MCHYTTLWNNTGHHIRLTVTNSPIFCATLYIKHKHWHTLHTVNVNMACALTTIHCAFFPNDSKSFHPLYTELVSLLCNRSICDQVITRSGLLPYVQCFKKRNVRPATTTITHREAFLLTIIYTITTSAPCPKQITMPAAHHLVFTGWMPFLLLPSQQRKGKSHVAIYKISLTKLLTI